MDLRKFYRFKNQDCKLTKTGSKRAGSMIGVSQFEEGPMTLMEFPLRETETVSQVAVMVAGNGFGFIRTSPIVAIVEETETSISFETEGGYYLLEFSKTLSTTYYCDKCEKEGECKDMTLKMGGLLCPDCRVIIFYPGSKVFFNELRKRQEN